MTCPTGTSKPPDHNQRYHIYKQTSCNPEEAGTRPQAWQLTLREPWQKDKQYWTALGMGQVRSPSESQAQHEGQPLPQYPTAVAIHPAEGDPAATDP